MRCLGRDAADEQPNHKWVKLACTVLSTMLANPEGIKYLTEDKLLRQMVECFNELDQVSDSSTKEAKLTSSTSASLIRSRFSRGTESGIPSRMGILR